MLHYIYLCSNNEKLLIIVQFKNKMYINLLFIELQIILLKVFGPKIWCIKELFGYQAVHQLDMVNKNVTEM